VGLRRGILSSVKPKRSENQESASRRLFGTTTLEGVKGE
jgi:hypothetical protein